MEPNIPDMSDIQASPKLVWIVILAINMIARVAAPHVNLDPSLVQTVVNAAIIAGFMVKRLLMADKPMPKMWTMWAGAMAFICCGLLYVFRNALSFNGQPLDLNYIAGIADLFVMAVAWLYQHATKKVAIQHAVGIAIAQHERKMESLGWKRPEAPPTYTGPRG